MNEKCSISNLGRSISFAATLLVVGLIWLSIQGSVELANSFSDSSTPKEVQTSTIIGNLGGVAVSIPKPYANLVEYDDDPHFTESHKGSPSKRTLESKLRSFGFEIRFPDMAPLTDKTHADKRKQSIQTTSWILVGINSNANYGTGGDDALERRVAWIKMADASRIRYTYEALPGQIHGLTGYTPVGIDESRRGGGVLVDGKAADMSDKNVYFHRGKDGRVDAYIECSNMKHSAATCQHRFNLLPAMRSHVSVSYRRELLSQWREIQSSVTQVILGFAVDPKSQKISK